MRVSNKRCFHLLKKKQGNKNSDSTDTVHKKDYEDARREPTDGQGEKISQQPVGRKKRS